MPILSYAIHSPVGDHRGTWPTTPRLVSLPVVSVRILRVRPTYTSSLPSGETSPAVVDDATIQSEIDKTLASDSALANLDVSTLVENGKVTIVGSVKSLELKQRVAREIRAIKGVTSIDNQLVVAESTPQ